MPNKEKIKEEFLSPPVDLSLDTIKKEKQALVFVNSKRSAEKTAEEIAKKIRGEHESLTQLAEQLKNSLSKPTKQCERLFHCAKKGIAFHHAGLAQKQKSIIEDSFREGSIKIICCTPTLAYGLDLPAYRSIIRDLRRFGKHGLSWIPVLEYLQIAGRAGRPNYDNKGEAIIIAASDADKQLFLEKYVNGEPEEIYSKLAVEPVMRTYLLSLIATNFTPTKKAIKEFFSKTFYAYQFKDVRRLEIIIDKMLYLLEEWEFITITGGQGDFTSADEVAEEKLKATLLGKRVAELYIDPLTAYSFITAIREASSRKLHTMSFLHLVTHTQELMPLLKVRVREQEKIQEELILYDTYLLEHEPSLYDPAYQEYLNAFKTALMLHDWVEENAEDYLLETYTVRPGELKVKLDTADWLLYAAEELSKILQFKNVNKELSKVRFRLKYGVKEELFPLLKFDGIGRVRARRLFNNRIRSVGDITKSDLTTLKQVVGEKIALNLKKQVGQEEKVVPTGTRKDQLSLNKFKK